MRHAGAVTVGSVVALAAIGAGGFAQSSLAAGDAAVATPPGITLQPLGSGQGYGYEARLAEFSRKQIAYADAKGLTLYTYDGDSPGKSRCTEGCAKEWPAALAPSSARPLGDWSIFKRPDGTRQWQYRGRPLYTFVHDEDVGSLFGVSPKRPRSGAISESSAARGGNSNQGESPLAAWHPALLFPDSDVAMPAGIALREVGDAGGLAFVDQKGMTLYLFYAGRDSKAGVTLADRTQWKPVVAPQLAHPIGEWSVNDSGEGIRQWTLRGKPLFTFVGDLAPGDANGVGLSSHWIAALAVSFYTPPDVRVERTLARGKVLATASGMTLYRRDGVALNTGGGQSLHHGIPIRPGVGRNIGISGCEGDCLQTWHPFLAPANVQPDGYWDVAVRPDGTHQWVYQGYALYTYSGDHKPGDMNGSDIFNMVLSNSSDRPNEVGTPMHGTAGLYWTVAYP